MDPFDRPEIDPSNLAKLESYWEYLGTHRRKIDEDLLKDNDIGLTFSPYLGDRNVK